MTNNNNKPKTVLGTIWYCICWPFRTIWKLLCKFWKWLSNINFIGLLNIALLSCIIVLFTTLIMDITNYDIHMTKYAGASHNDIDNVTVVEDSYNDNQKNTENESIKISDYAQKRLIVKRTPLKTAVRQTAVVHKAKSKNDRQILAGDVIIDSHDAEILIVPGTHIRGNLYLQNMRKYILPCNTEIDGNLFLRDLHMLKFCGSFKVKGNIYVSPTSSFGPLPKSARIGGQIIL